MSPTSYLAAPPRVKSEKPTLSNDTGFVNMLPRFSAREFITKITKRTKNTKGKRKDGAILNCGRLFARSEERSSTARSTASLFPSYAANHG
jgi:hypothetical protein